MTIEVKLFATLRMHLGVASVSIETDSPPTIKQMIDMISERIGEDIREWLVEPDGSVRMGTMILLEGHNMLHMDGLDTLVTVKDVAVFPPAGGG